MERLMLGVALTAHLLLSTTFATVRELFHDEGGTLDQIAGRLNLPSDIAQAPSAADVYRRLDTLQGARYRDVVPALETRGMLPPAYNLLLHAWARLFGTETAMLRLPGIVIGALSVVGFFVIAGLIMPHRGVRGWVALLAAVAPWHVELSAYVRPYILAVALTVWTTALLFALAEATSLRRRAATATAYVALSVAGLYTVYYYAFVIAAQALAWATDRREPRQRDRFVLPLAWSVIVLAFLPWTPMLWHHLRVTAAPEWYFAGRFAATEWPRATVTLVRRFLFADFNAPLAMALLIVVAGALVVAWLRGHRDRWWSDERRARLSRQGLFLVVLLIAADLVRGTHAFFITRPAFALFPLGMLVIVASFDRVTTPGLRRGLLAWLTCLLLAVTAVRAVREHGVASDFRRVAATVKSADSPSHFVVVTSSPRGYLYPFVQTLRDAGVQNVRLASASVTAVPMLAKSLRPGEMVTVVQFAVRSMPVLPASGVTAPDTQSNRVVILAPASSRGFLD